PGLGGGERHAENRVGAEPGLVLRSVELDQPRVERPLVLGVEPHNSRRQLRIDIANGPENALAAIHALVAVAQLDGLELSGRRARRNSRASGRARLERDVHLDRRVAARVEDLAPVHACDRGGAHSNSSLARSKYRSCSSRGSAANDFPSSAAERSARSTRSTKRRDIARRASSGSTFSRRATLTAAKSTSPISANTCAGGSVSGTSSSASASASFSSRNSSSRSASAPAVSGYSKSTAGARR